LNAVVGTLDNVIDGTIEEERRPQRLRAVRGQLLGVIELARNLAFLAQISTERGRQTLAAKKVPISIPEVAIEAALFLQESAENRGIKIHLTDRVTQYMALGHKDLLRQVFLNIIENAVKYSDEGTKISLEGHQQKKTGDLIFEISSLGPGFSPQERDKIFELGFRGSNAREVSASGSGLGLYICRQVLDFHGSSIEAEYSSSSKLTVFRIRFPGIWIDEEATERMRAKDKKP